MTVLYLGVVLLGTLAKPTFIDLPGSRAVLRYAGEIAYGNWAQHLAVYLLIWTGFVGASVAAKEQKHLAVDVAQKLFKGKAALVVQAIGAVITAGFLAFLTWVGIGEVLASLELEDPSKVKGVPLWVFQLVIPLSAATMAVRFLMTIGRPPPPRKLE